MLVLPDDVHNRDHNERSDDRERSVSPSPATGVNERLSCRRSDKSGDDVRSGGNGCDERSVFETRSIGYKNIENIADAIKPDPIENLNVCVSRRDRKSVM
jgi:hypothetical protein